MHGIIYYMFIDTGFCYYGSLLASQSVHLQNCYWAAGLRLQFVLSGFEILCCIKRYSTRVRRKQAALINCSRANHFFYIDPVCAG